MSSTWGRWTRLWSQLTRSGVEREVEEELRFHYEMLVAEYESRGLERGEAERRARARFGEGTRVRRAAVRAQSARVRGERRVRYLEGLGRDMGYALRTLRRNPSFAITAVLVLAVGIGANAAIFSAANAFLFQPLPFAEPDRLVTLYETNPEFGWDMAAAAPANVLDWREQVRSFSDVAMYTEYVSRVTYVRDGEPTLMGATNVTGNFFDVLGVRPILGRTFGWDETWQGRDEIAVLSYAAWQDRFGADPEVIGRTVDVGTASLRVVGVLPRGFNFPDPSIELWTPWGWDLADREAAYFRRAHWVRPVARLAPGATLGEANAELQGVVARLQDEYPETNAVMGAGLMPLRDFLVRDVRLPLYVLLGAVALLLLLACANVANLMLVRAADRAREVAVRFALGAGRHRVARLVLVEGLVLALAGGGLGLGLGWASIHVLTGARSVGIPGATELALDVRVVLFTLLATVASALVFGIAPALRSAAGDGAQHVLKDGGRGSAGRRARRLANGLVALEVAVAVILVVGAGLMVRTAWNLRSVDPGVRTENVLAVRFEIPSSRYPNRDQVLAFQDEFEARLEGRAGIQGAGMVGQLPLNGTSWSSQFQAEGWPAERVGFEILHRRADAAYFNVLDVPLLRGRLFGPQDGPDAPLVVVINEAFAEEHFPGEDPIGQRIAYDRAADESSIWYEIVGIVGDQLQISPAEPARPEVFEHRAQDWGRGNWTVIRTHGDPAAATAIARDVLRELDPLIPLAAVRPLREVWHASMARYSFLLSLLTAFGAVALLLASIGVYGVTAQAARRRNHEIGIRLALGAGSRRVVRLMVLQGMTVVAVGLVVGLAVALTATRAMGALLYDVAPTDPVTLAAVALTLSVVAGAASYLPARRATRQDPVHTLRVE